MTIALSETQRTDFLVRPPAVLIVDDEECLRTTLADHLTRAGFAVAEAADAGEAMRRMRTREFDILFADVNMPGPMDGPALVGWAEGRWPHMLTLLTSGGPNEAGRPNFVPKPYRSQEVERLFRDLLARAAH